MLTSCEGELPNPYRNCVRQILASLICLNEDLLRINIELRNVQEEYEREIDKIEKKCSMLKTIVCGENVEWGERGDELRDFSKQLHTIDEVNECFKGKIEKVKQQRDEVLNNGRVYVLQLQDEKCKFKKFHENTIEHLKWLIIKTEDPTVVSNCEKDICSMQKQYVDEVSYMKRTENDLRDFINHLKDENINEICKSCCFREYDWLPAGKNFDEVSIIDDEFKKNMGATLKRAFAELQLHQPTDTKSFLAGYLFNVYHNEQLLAEKLDLFGNFKLQKKPTEQTPTIGVCPSPTRAKP